MLIPYLYSYIDGFYSILTSIIVKMPKTHTDMHCAMTAHSFSPLFLSGIRRRMGSCFRSLFLPVHAYFPSWLRVSLRQLCP